MAKIWAVMFAMIWTRGTLVRIRYDHFMKLGWKVLIPAALTWFVMVSVVTGVRTFSGTQPRTLLLVLAAVFLVVTAVLVLVPERGSQEAPSPPGSGPGELVAPGQVLDAFAGGFPVPPLPGQVLPPSPRSRRAGAGAFLPAADPGTAPTEGGNR